MGRTTVAFAPRSARRSPFTVRFPEQPVTVLGRGRVTAPPRLARPLDHFALPCSALEIPEAAIAVNNADEHIIAAWLGPLFAVAAAACPKQVR
jgi:hypothetical protein